MIYLILCILCSSLLVFLFKVFDHYKIDAYPAIVFNYITCVICGLLHSSSSPLAVANASLHAPWLWLAILMGVLFIHVFNLVGITALRFGVSTASVAMKLGLVLPVLLAFIVYHEPFTWYKVVGILCALVAVVLASIKERAANEQHIAAKGAALLLPLLVLFSSGICDSGAQLGDKLYFPNGGADNFVIVIFLIAGITGLCYLTVKLWRGKVKLQWNQVIGGIALGIPNYGSLLFIMKALDIVEGGSSVVFPINNIATVVVSTLLSVLFFKEHLNRYNRLGIVFAMLCIFFLYFPQLVSLLN